MSGSTTTSYVRTGYRHNEDGYRLSHPSWTMSLTQRSAIYSTSLYPPIVASETILLLCTIKSDDEDGHRFSHSTTPHLRTLHLPAASPLLTPGAPEAIRVDLCSNLETFIHYTSREPATAIPNLKRMVLTCRDYFWTIYVDAQPGARTITVQDVVRAVYRNLRTRITAMEVKILRGEQACLEEARGRRLGKWLGDEKPGHTFLRRVDVLNRRTLFVGIRPSSYERSRDGSTMEWTVCLEVADE
ncbi:hypothetical protein CPB85DRAFT_900221 [Mucidula mucida]|nr:hypothetical protein CPB85DRAFT_900221 [Mucidula mucida]